MSQACFIAVLVARAADKFPLCSFADPSFQQQRGPAIASSVCTEQMERVLARFKPAPNANQIQSFDFQEFTYYLLPDVTAIVVMCVNRNAGPFAAAPAGSSIITQSSCRLLEDINSEFQTMYRPELIASASRKYQFIRFDQQLTKLIRRATQNLTSAASRAAASSSAVSRPPAGIPAAAAAQDDGSSLRSRAGASTDPYAAIRQEVADVHNVMRQNLDDLMTRGERLETMSVYSNELKESSNNYHQVTQKMNRMRLLKLYGPPIVVILIIAVYVWFFYLK